MDAEYGVCGAGNGVAQVAAVDLYERQLVFEAQIIEEACEELVGIGSAEVYVAARVASEAARDLEAEIMEVGGRERSLVGEQAGGVYAAGAAYEDFGVVLGVEVEQDRAREHAVAEIVGAGESGLLIDGEESLYRAVHEIFVDHHCE